MEEYINIIFSIIWVSFIIKMYIDIYDLKYKVKELEQKVDMMDMYLVQYRRRVEWLESKVNKEYIHRKWWLRRNRLWYWIYWNKNR